VNPSAIARTGNSSDDDRVRIDCDANGGATVDARYRPMGRGPFLLILLISFILLGGEAMVAWWLFHRQMGTRTFVFAFAGLVGATMLVSLIRTHWRGSRCVVRADADGVTIQITRGRRELQRRLPREQVKDIRLGFDHSGKSTRASAWLVIVTIPWHHRNVRCLAGFGGDELARAADALRAAIGLPKRSWP
jgi:hypothetical protein